MVQQDSNEKDFALLLREYRREMGWSQTELSVRWSYSFETISAWERRKRTPSKTELPRLSRLLGVKEQELVAMVAKGKGGGSSSLPVSDCASVSPSFPIPFSSGRLLWSLHLGMDATGLQCVVTCPLASGESWSLVLDPDAVQQVYQLVSVQVGRTSQEEPAEGQRSNVVPLRVMKGSAG